MDVAITKISSKGQIVIPTSMRKDLTKGDQFLIIKEDKTLIIKKITELTKDERGFQVRPTGRTSMDRLRKREIQITSCQKIS